MKPNHLKLSILLLTCILSIRSISQTHRRTLPMDVKLDNFSQDHITTDPCGMNTVTISFDVINKRSSTAAVCILEFEILNTAAGFTIMPPAECNDVSNCIRLNPGQTRRVRASATVLNSWAEETAPVLSITATPHNIPGGDIYFEEVNKLDNTLNNPLLLSNAVTAENGYCQCNNPGTSEIDTSGVYIIQEYIRKQVGPVAVSSATLAIPFNLRPLLTRSDAASFKFRFAGYYNGDQRMPMYTIAFAESNLYLSRENNMVVFRTRDGSNQQKWLLKSNLIGGYGIFSFAEPGQRCYALGTPANMPPAVNSVLALRLSYDAGNLFQSFTLVKVQQ